LVDFERGRLIARRRACARSTFPAASTALVKIWYEPVGNRFGKRRLQTRVPLAETQWDRLQLVARVSRAPRATNRHFLPWRSEIETDTTATELLSQPPSSAVPRRTWLREATLALEPTRERGRLRSVHAGGLAGVVTDAGGVAAGGGSSVASAGVTANDRHATTAAMGM
jgi:hypothetical protein